MAITVGSVEVDVIPNTQGIYARLRAGLVPAATRAGQDAGDAAGRAFGPAMTSSVSGTIGDRIGQQIASRITAQIRTSVASGLNQGGAAARASATRQGGDAGGAFGSTFRRRVQAALAALPDITIGADTSEADADIRALREQLVTLSNQRVGIDVDAATARRQIDDLEQQLTRLGANHPNVDVRINTGAAVAQLAALRAEIARLDGQDIDVRVDPVIRSFGMLTTAAAAFGPAILPAIPVVAAGLGAVAAAAVSAGVGIGALTAVAIPAFVGIAGALQAQKAAQDAATQSTGNGAAAHAAAQQRAIQMAGAAQSLAAAERNGARQIAAAQDQVANARRGVADATAQAAQRTQQAARQVQDAERALADAQRVARRAQEELTDARKSAAEQLQDLNDRLAGTALDERAAILRVQEAQEDLNKVRGDKKATDLQRAQAQLAYDQAVKGLKDQRKETAELKSEAEAANRAGVEGSDTVKAAHERVAEAQRQVADQAREVKDAQADAAQSQVQNAQNIADAQQKVIEAQKNVAAVQEQAADSIASAQRQVASASRSVATGVDAAAVAQEKYRTALAKLTPAARQTFDAFVSLKGVFGEWSKSLQPAVMPIFTRALEGIKNSLPGLTPFVLAAAKAIGNLQDRISAGFKSPWWKSFKADLAGSVGPAIEGLGISFGRIFKGMAGIVQAFLPHMDGISKTMQRITGRFATWGTNLKGSPEFERFLAYAAKQAPLLAETLRKLFGAILHLGIALAPMVATAQSFINALTTGISAIPLEVLVVAGVAFASIAIGAKLAALAMAIWRGAVIAAGVVTAILTGQTLLLNTAMRANVIGIIITLIAALVVAIIYAYQNSETFRNIVQGAWEGIKTTISFIWNSILKPAFDAIVVAFKAIASAASWLWNTVLSPVFSFIGTAAKILITIIVTLLVLPYVFAFKAMAAIATWLWDNVLSPVFTWIGNKAAWLWQEKIKPAWDRLKIGIGLVADKVKELWNTYVKPIFTWIGEKAAWLWTEKIKPSWDSFKIGMKLVGDKIKELWNDYAKPVFGWIGDKAKWLWDKSLKPSFDLIKKGVKAVGDSFEDARGFIGKAWDKVRDIAKKPVRFIIDKIYNNGIVPTWNKVASAFGAPEIKPMNIKGWATGGVLPGYTPGKDVHRFVSPTGGALDLSGGEAIMRPEFTRAVGSGFVSTMNKIASSRGATGVKAALAPALGGNPTTQKFADGGIFGWIGKTVKGVGSKAWDGVKKGASWLADTVEASARAGLNSVVNPLMNAFPGAGGDFGKMIRRIPKRILDSIFGYSEKADKKGAGGIGGPRMQAGLKWARTQNGKPYQWGGNGNPSWDCSGFLSAIESVIRGQKPHRRWATGAFAGKTAPSGWVLNGRSPYQIGITNAGVGHTAGTINKVNVESRGGDGVVVGSRARPATAAMFTHRYGFMPGKYDSGGYLQPGLNLAYNGTGRPEPVFTSQQANALTSTAATGAPGIAKFEGDLYLSGGEFLGRVRGEAEQVVDGRFDMLRRRLEAGFN
ncbi:hypothetical protein J7E96_09705 [Streptomyces sp. ISL-96]|uniref:hypothetical protein n=1 Tax=Streptomyces sp. ISL-96 TaxID=2819191 RepID=UPI001BE91D56|nr:hypothetical protein [Streptomyces sp. ISL-96]MBT2488792.1 hypothetical protein [Streptomyces sp. ISL-96]